MVVVVVDVELLIKFLFGLKYDLKKLIFEFN